MSKHVHFTGWEIILEPFSFMIVASLSTSCSLWRVRPQNVFWSWVDSNVPEKRNERYWISIFGKSLSKFKNGAWLCLGWIWGSFIPDSTYMVVCFDKSGQRKLSKLLNWPEDRSANTIIDTKLIIQIWMDWPSFFCDSFSSHWIIFFDVNSTLSYPEYRIKICMPRRLLLK